MNMNSLDSGPSFLPLLMQLSMLLKKTSSLYHLPPEEVGDTGVRRLILERFPYDIVAIELPEETVVIAVAHHSRKPGYWLERSKP